jgi:hypothetical protein
MNELHRTYAPILRFARGERFYPMRVEDMLQYSSLCAKGQDKPLLRQGEVTPDQLARHKHDPAVFLRSVEAGPLRAEEVVSNWGQQTLDLVYQWAHQTTSSWTESLARRAYSWFSPKTMGATQLFWWNGLIAPLLATRHSPPATRHSPSSEDLPRLILPEETRDDAAERYTFRLGRMPENAYYYRQVRDGPYLCLQYWFFYSFNDWARGFGGMNDHEGDWEGMLLFFQLDGRRQAYGRPPTKLVSQPPAHVTFVGHHSRLTKPWEHQDVERVGTHPVGYVAAGSHATYPERKPYPIMERYGLVDHATGDGVTIDHDQWVHRIDLDSVPWLTDYLGSWGTRFWLPLERARAILGTLAAVSPALGIAAAAAPREIELPGVSAPHGPRFGDTGDQRPQWMGPAAWAGLSATEVATTDL